VTNAYVLGRARVDGRPASLVTMLDRRIPAWFTVWIDRKTSRPLRLAMTAPAHFMTDRYTSFNAPLRIEPPETVR
jgi:hypothetical protein